MAALLSLGLPGIVVLLVALIIVWIIASIPVYIAGKLVTKGRATFGEAMGATLGGILVYIVVDFAATFFLGAILFPAAPVWGIVLGFVAFLAVYRASFDTGWLGAIAIAVVAVIVAVILGLLLSALFGVSIPPAPTTGVNL